MTGDDDGGNDHAGAEPPDRLHVAVGVVMTRYGTDALGGFRWIIDESHRTGRPIGDVISVLVEQHGRADHSRGT